MNVVIWSGMFTSLLIRSVDHFQRMFFKVLKEFHCNLMWGFQPVFQIQLIFIICWFHICSFACVLKFICSPKSIPTLLFWSFVKVLRAVKIVVLYILFPAEARGGSLFLLVSAFILQTSDSAAICLEPHLCPFSCVTLLLKMAPYYICAL